MNIRTTTAMLVAAAMLQSVAVHAQVSTQELYNVKFKATCKPGDSSNGKSTKMDNTDLIEQVVGGNVTSKDAKKTYAVVYNPSTDSIQVVNRVDGSLLGDVFVFQGGTNVVSGDQLSRFVFVFSPNQSDAIGSAVITERAENNSKKARIEGKIQFTMPSSTASSASAAAASTDTNSNNSTNSSSTDTNQIPLVTGDTNNSTGRDGTDNNNGASNGAFVQAEAAATTSTAVDICSGTFSAGKLFVPGANNNNNNGNNEDTNTTGEIGGVTNTPSTSTNTVATNSVDGKFLTQAAQTDMFEIQLATLAAQNSTNQDVINFANQLIQDHTASSAQLQQLAANKGITLPTALTSANQTTLNNLSKQSGAAFDRSFASREVTVHQSAIQLYNNEVAKGDDADVKSFASAELPTLQQHLATAQQLKTQL